HAERIGETSAAACARAHPDLVEPEVSHAAARQGEAPARRGGRGREVEQTLDVEGRDFAKAPRLGQGPANHAAGERPGGVAKAAPGQRHAVALPAGDRGRMAARPREPEPRSRRSRSVSAWSSRVWATATAAASSSSMTARRNA